MDFIPTHRRRQADLHEVEDNFLSTWRESQTSETLSKKKKKQLQQQNRKEYVFSFRVLGEDYLKLGTNKNEIWKHDQDIGNRRERFIVCVNNQARGCKGGLAQPLELHINSIGFIVCDIENHQ